MMEFLRCLLLPVGNQTLLLPYSAVAEVVERDLQSNGFSFLKKISWRAITLPLIYLDDSMGVQNKSSSKKNIAVLNRFSENTPLDFMGIVLSGVPSMHRYKRTDMEWMSTSSVPYGLMNVKVRGQMAMIPQLDFLMKSAEQ